VRTIPHRDSRGKLVVAAPLAGRHMRTHHEDQPLGGTAGPSSGAVAGAADAEVPWQSSAVMAAKSHNGGGISAAADGRRRRASITATHRGPGCAALLLVAAGLSLVSHLLVPLLPGGSQRGSRRAAAGGGRGRRRGRPGRPAPAAHRIAPAPGAWPVPVLQYCSMEEMRREEFPYFVIVRARRLTNAVNCSESQ
jgi:hypothetical protein